LAPNITLGVLHLWASESGKGPKAARGLAVNSGSSRIDRKGSQGGVKGADQEGRKPIGPGEPDRSLPSPALSLIRKSLLLLT
jgi:hypothetical protein